MDDIPHVTRADVLRVIRREFAPEDHDMVLSLLDEYGAEPWHQERDRVQLAILKEAKGNLDDLVDLIDIANFDFRDVLVLAEYPRFWEVGFTGIEQMSPAEIKQLQEDDWRQYQAWLDRGQP